MTMRNLGLSIYPDHSTFEDNANYLKLGHKYGTLIFNPRIPFLEIYPN